MSLSSIALQAADAIKRPDVERNLVSYEKPDGSSIPASNKDVAMVNGVIGAVEAAAAVPIPWVSGAAGAVEFAAGVALGGIGLLATLTQYLDGNKDEAHKVAKAALPLAGKLMLLGGLTTIPVVGNVVNLIAAAGDTVDMGSALLQDRA